jgi:hypothetical protein
MRSTLLLIAALSIVGCQTGVLPNPNEPTTKEEASPEILKRNLGTISDGLMEKRMKGSIDEQQYRDLLAKAADELVDELDLEHVDPEEAWQYAEILRAGRDWKPAKRLLVLAVKEARAVKNEDRRVNDSLRLAEAEAHLGEYEASLRDANSVMDAKPVDSAPILPAVLLEIAPVLAEHGHNLEVAKLLETAARKHLLTTVDGSTRAGKDFIMARPYHVRRAYIMAADLYERSGKPEDKERMLENVARVARDLNGLIQQLQGNPTTRA